MTRGWLSTFYSFKKLSLDQIN